MEAAGEERLESLRVLSKPSMSEVRRYQSIDVDSLLAVSVCLSCHWSQSLHFSRAGVGFHVSLLN